MGFNQNNRPTKAQVSLNSWEGVKQSVKEDANNIKELGVGTAKTIGKTAVRAVKTVGDYYGHSSNNKDLKARMSGHSSFRERTRDD
jgi:hypothetical protein